MTPTAVFFLILAAVVIWGGLLASIARLRHDGRRDATTEPGGRPYGWDADGGQLSGRDLDYRSPGVGQD